MMHGKGVFQWTNGQTFSGHYQRDRKEGRGVLKLADGTVVRGVWAEGQIEGESEVVRAGVSARMRWKKGV